MTKRKHTKLVHKGNYIAEVDIEIIDSYEGWSPYIPLEDALKLDDVREALRRNNIAAADKIARVYTISRVKVA
ncbi:MAG: hypothetical protein JXA18_01325 [Chitinispirillaceae bacterium]|nr:hypothetical protein [Chitinispirillaceae bacterium]